MGCRVTSIAPVTTGGSAANGEDRGAGNQLPRARTSPSERANSDQPVPRALNPLALDLDDGATSSRAHSPINSILEDAFSPAESAEPRWFHLDESEPQSRAGAARRTPASNPLAWDCHLPISGSPNVSVVDHSIVTCSAGSDILRAYDSMEMERPKSVRGFPAIEPSTPGWVLMRQHHISTSDQVWFHSTTETPAARCSSSSGESRNRSSRTCNDFLVSPSHAYDREGRRTDILVGPL